MNRLLAKLRALFRKEKLDRDMAEEMRFHLAQRAADQVDDGMAPDEARFAAQRKFGGVEQIKERYRDERVRAERRRHRRLLGPARRRQGQAARANGARGRGRRDALCRRVLRRGRER